MARRPNKATGTSTDSGVYSQEGKLKCDTIADIRDPKMTDFSIEFYKTVHPDGRVTSYFIIFYVIEGTVLFSCRKLSCTSNCVTDAPVEGSPFFHYGRIFSDTMNNDVVQGLLLAYKRYEEAAYERLGEDYDKWKDFYEEGARKEANSTGEPVTVPWPMPSFRSDFPFAGWPSAERLADLGWISDPRTLPNWDGDWSISLEATHWEMKMFKNKFPQSMNDTIKDRNLKNYGPLNWLADLGVPNPNANWLCYCERVIGGVNNLNARSSLDSLLPRD
jgi:hypothetical protein